MCIHICQYYRDGHLSLSSMHNTLLRTKAASLSFFINKVNHFSPQNSTIH